MNFKQFTLICGHSFPRGQAALLLLGSVPSGLWLLFCSDFRFRSSPSSDFLRAKECVSRLSRFGFSGHWILTFLLNKSSVYFFLEESPFRFQFPDECNPRCTNDYGGVDGHLGRARGILCHHRIIAGYCIGRIQLCYY